MTLPQLFLGVPTGTHPPAAQAARLDADVEPLSLPHLPEDLREQILGYAVNYSEEFEDAPKLPEDRVGVPYPVGHALHGKCKEDFAIPEIGVCGIWPNVCREYLVTALLTKEKEYWEDPSRGQNFDNVLGAIRRRDGVQVVTLPANDKLNLQERLALRRIDEEKLLSWPNAIAIVLRARHWYAKYVAQHGAGAHRFGFTSPHGRTMPLGQNGLSAAVRFLTLARAIVRLRDATQHADRDELARVLLMSINIPVFNPAGVRPPAVVGDLYVTEQSINGPTTVEQCMNEAMEIINVYGPPDAWNTSDVIDFNSAFSAVGIWQTDSSQPDTPLLNWRGGGRRYQIPTPEAHREMLGRVQGTLGTSVLQVDWTVGLYDTSRATTMIGCFTNCSQFNGYLHGWDTSSVIDMDMCFLNCTAFNRPLNAWNVGMCDSFMHTFNGCAAFNQPLGDWRVYGTTSDTMKYMFANCTAFAQPLDEWYPQIEDRGPVVRMFYQATEWLERAKQQREGGAPFSLLARYVDLDTGDLNRMERREPDSPMDL